MKPETIKRLQENVPELRELIAFLSAEATKLNTLDGVIDFHDPIQLAVAVKARIRAYETISTMLAPLVSPIDKPVGTDPKEFVM